MQRSIRSVKRDGYCAASWQRGVLAVATPIIVKRLPVYAINMSTQNVQPTSRLSAEMGAYLLAFATKCNEALAGR